MHFSTGKMIASYWDSLLFVLDGVIDCWNSLYASLSWDTLNGAGLTRSAKAAYPTDRKSVV